MIQVLSERELPSGLVIQHKRYSYPALTPWQTYGAFYRDGNMLDYACGPSVRDAVTNLRRTVAWKAAA